MDRLRDRWRYTVLEGAVSVLIVGATAAVCFVSGWQAIALIGAIFVG